MEGMGVHPAHAPLLHPSELPEETLGGLHRRNGSWLFSANLLALNTAGSLHIVAATDARHGGQKAEVSSWWPVVGAWTLRKIPRADEPGLCAREMFLGPDRCTSTSVLPGHPIRQRGRSLLPHSMLWKNGGHRRGPESPQAGGPSILQSADPWGEARRPWGAELGEEPQ